MEPGDPGWWPLKRANKINKNPVGLNMFKYDDEELASHPLCSWESRRHKISKISVGTGWQLREAQCDRPDLSQSSEITKPEIC